MSGDNAARDNGDLRDPLKVERSVVLPYVPESVTEARQGLCADLRALEVRADRVDDAALILSELVSNALRHASPLPDHTVGLSWRVEIDPDTPNTGWLEILVHDGGSSTMPRVARPSLSGLGGRGLSIVQSLAGRWGTEMDSTTTTVWAVLEIATDEAVEEGYGTVTDLPVSSVEEDHGGPGPGPGAGPGAGAAELDLRVGEGEPAWGALR